MKEKNENRDKQQERNMKLASPSETLAQNLSTKVYNPPQSLPQKEVALMLFIIIAVRL